MYIYRFGWVGGWDFNFVAANANETGSEKLRYIYTEPSHAVGCSRTCRFLALERELHATKISMCSRSPRVVEIDSEFELSKCANISVKISSSDGTLPCFELHDHSSIFRVARPLIGFKNVVSGGIGKGAG